MKKNSSFLFSLLGLVVVGLLPWWGLAEEPKIHLISLSDQGDSTLTNCSNADIAKITGLFLNNVPNKRLTITHLIVNQGKWKPKETERKIEISTEPRLLEEECSLGCKYEVDYIGDIRSPTCLHVVTKPVCENVGSGADILHVLENVTISSDDTVVFYYTGHGEYRPINGLIYKFSNGQRCELTRVKKTLERKSPRLLVLLSDCCVLFPKKEEFILEACAADMKGCPNRQKISLLFDELFIKTSGIVEMIAVKQGTALAYDSGDDLGGIFTEALLRCVPEDAVDDDKYYYRRGIDEDWWYVTNDPPKTNWDHFYKDISKQANKLFKDKYPNGKKVRVVKGIRQVEELMTTHEPYYKADIQKKSP